VKDGSLLDKNISKARVFSAFAQLRLIMRDLEVDLEVDDLTSTELDILAVSIRLANAGKTFSSSEIVAHPILRESARATVYRAINSLASRGFLVPDATRANQYSLNLGVP
jgi:hypothetical protein